MTEHDRIIEQLALSGAGDIPPGEIRRLQQHLATCEQCRRANEDYAFLADTLRSLPTPQPSAELLARVRAMAAARLAQNQESSREAALLAPLVVASWAVALATWPWLRAAGTCVFTGWHLPGGSVSTALAAYSIVGILMAGVAAIAVIRRAAAIGRMQ